MNKKMMKRLFTIIISIGVLVMGIVYFSFSGHPSVNTVFVSRGDIVSGVSLSGVVKAQKQAHLGFGSASPATITKLFTKTGDTVKAGTVIAQLENADVQALYDQSSATVSSASLLLDKLNASVKVEKLKVKGLGSNDKKVQQAEVIVAEKAVDVQRATLLGAQAGMRNAQAQLAKMTLRAPFDGVIAKQDVEVGDVAMPGVPIITFITEKDIFEIQAFVSEQDMPKMKIGDTADVTLDAYGNQVLFSAKVMEINPGETVQNGVSTYKVTFVFGESDERIKSGMSANIVLKTDEKKNVVEIPHTSIINRDGKQVVLVSMNGSQQEKEVTSGITGIDGMTEITAGLSGGEYIVK